VRVRVAVVDIGSNSTRLFIAEVEDGRVTAELERVSIVTRLGDRVDANGSLQQNAIARVLQALDEFAEAIDRYQPEKRVAVLTSAVRDATNGPEFAADIASRYGLETHILTGDEEARLTYLGATSERDRDDTTPTLVIDIGGGSTELVIGEGGEVTFHVSTQAGVVRQSERHLHTDPPTAAELKELKEDVRQILEAAVPEQHRTAVQHGVAVAGTATSLAAIALELDPYDPERVHGCTLTIAQIEEIRERLARMSLEERRHVKGLHPDRAPTIVAGIVILIEVLALFGLSEVEVSEHDILRGAALGLTRA
jgi:exopolyphosphatase/guanosine-5'-triphosphate,3'-diphosphate pyrophosphatase